MVVLAHHEVVLYFAILVVQLRTDNGAPVVLAAQGAAQTTRIDFKCDILTDVRTLDGDNSERVCFCDLFLRDNDRLIIEVRVLLRVTKELLLPIITLPLILDGYLNNASNCVEFFEISYHISVFHLCSCSRSRHSVGVAAALEDVSGCE